MDTASQGSILDEYDRAAEYHLAFCNKVGSLVKELLEEAGIRSHSIDGRLKARESLFKKVIRPDVEYERLADITDVAGLRVITYFSQDVDRIARIIEDEFAIDHLNSVDKREVIESDRFGYMSLHYVASFSPERLQLREYKRFEGLKIEIQLRSILQHAWAEIEHDLGYKGHLEVPREVRRRFSRLSGLLELADSEFNQIRSTLSSYEEQVANQIVKAPDQVLIDRASVENFVLGGPIVAEVDAEIANALGRRINHDNFYPEQLVQQLANVDLETIADVTSALQARRHLVKPFVLAWFADEGDAAEVFDWLPPGFSLFYLCLILAAQHHSVAEVLGYLRASQIGNDDDRQRMAERVVGLCLALTHPVESGV